MPTEERKDICRLAEVGLWSIDSSYGEGSHEQWQKIWDDFCLTDEDRERLAQEEAARWVECDACSGQGRWLDEGGSGEDYYYYYDECGRCDGKGKIHKSVIEAEQRKKQRSPLYWHPAPGGIKDGQHRAVIVENGSIKNVFWANSADEAMGKAREVADAHNATLLV